MTSLSRWVRLAVAATAACALAAGCLAQEEAASVKLMAPAGGTSSLQFANAANNGASSFVVEHSEADGSLVFSSDGDAVLSAGSDRTVHVPGDLVVGGNLVFGGDGEVGGLAASLDELQTDIASLRTCRLGAQDRPAASCLALLTDCPWATSGRYWLQVKGIKFQAYCDMDTDDGGWTLVYSYTFTNYDEFTSGDNAVTPRPSWPAPSGQTTISTTAPAGPDSLGALPFHLWSRIGDSFLVTSNINDHVSCSPGTGSLVDFRDGSISCRHIEEVAPACDAQVPDEFKTHDFGAYISDSAGSLYYYWDANLDSNWPTHDPCGTNTPNHLDGHEAPMGAIWLRGETAAAQVAGARQCIPGTDRVPARSCLHLKAHCPWKPSGVYWIKPSRADSPRQMYCEMADELDGGGWTLVYSYGFTNYDQFTSSDNAVTPIPNWPVDGPVHSPVSTTPPLSPRTPGAVPFDLWDKLGQNILLKSNINDWHSCKPGSGSLTGWTAGSVSCRNINDRVAASCDGHTPNTITLNAYGPYFSDSSLSSTYYYDGNTAGNWPTHDPCHQNTGQHEQGVEDPGGEIYVRADAI